MLRGELVALRARHDSDIPILDAELQEDVMTMARSDHRPWRPIPPGRDTSRFAAGPPSEQAAVFSVVALADDELVGDAVLWAIDTHRRQAHIGVSLRPRCRGRGFATDVVKVLCHYGFVVLGLHRLQIETLADNASMIGAAKRAGFTAEGTLRESAWVTGEFADQVVLGQLAGEWAAATAERKSG